MGLLISLTYFIIGFVASLLVYDTFCKDFNKQNKNSQFKLTWEEYSRKQGPGICMAFTIVIWPILLLIAICYYTFNCPINYIKKRNGIK